MRIANSIFAAAVFAVAILTVAPDAHAERRCEVAFVRVPDDVRLVIESWLKAEPKCTGSIELRVVPTDHGTLYLVAQRPDGRIHEREVPDAQSAGVLVASWVADDWTSERARDPEPAYERPAIEAPSLVASVPLPAPRPTASAPSNKWVTLGIMVNPENAEKEGGFHLDIDLIQRGAWTFGVSGEYAETVSGVEPFGATPWLHAYDWRLLLKAARVFRISERATLTASAGVGIVHTETTITTWMTTDDPNYVYQDVPLEGAAADLGATLSRELGDNWALSIGPRVSFQEQSHVLYDGTYVERPLADFMVLGGVRYRL